MGTALDYLLTRRNKKTATIAKAVGTALDFLVLQLCPERDKSLDKAPGERTDVTAQLKTSVRSLGGLSRDLSRFGHSILQTKQLLVLLLIAIAKFY